MIILLAITPIIVLDAVLVLVIVPRWAESTMRPLRERYPPVDPAPHAVWRSFQSFSFGMLNLGFSVNVAADEGYLHLRPALLGRWVRVPAMSIPWEEIEVPQRGRVRIGGQRVAMPQWCREYASRRVQAAS